MIGCQVCGDPETIPVGRFLGDWRNMCRECQGLSWSERDDLARRTFARPTMGQAISSLERIIGGDREPFDLKILFSFMFDQNLLALRMEARALEAEGEGDRRWLRGVNGPYPSSIEGAGLREAKRRDRLQELYQAGQRLEKSRDEAVADL